MNPKTRTKMGDGDFQRMEMTAQIRFTDVLGTLRKAMYLKPPGERQFILAYAPVSLKTKSFLSLMFSKVD
jgi:hypothetical protein